MTVICSLQVQITGAKGHWVCRRIPGRSGIACEVWSFDPPCKIHLLPSSKLTSVSQSPTFLGFRLYWVRLKGRGFYKVF